MAKKLDLDRAVVERFLNQISDSSDSAHQRFLSLPGWACVAIIVAVALLVRLIYFWQVSQTPFSAPLANTLDDGIYHKMAESILAGDFKENTEMAAYRVPAYPYFLAFIYQYFGKAFETVRWVQLVLGTASAVLVYHISRLVTQNKGAALGSGLLYGTYMTSIFFENMLLGETVSIFLALAAFLALIISPKHLTLKILLRFFSGVLFGSAILFRPHFLFAMPLIALTLMWADLKGEKMKLYIGALLCGVLTVGVATPILPITYRNYVLHQDRILLSAQGGINLYIGNHAQAEGDKAFAPGLGSDIDTQITKAIQIAEQETGKKLKPSEVSSYWTDETFKVIQSDVPRFARLMIKKISLMMNRYEIPDVLDMGFVFQFIPILGMTHFEYGLIVLLAVIGMGSGFFSKSRYRSRLLTALGVGYAIGLVMFFVTSRYRLPLVPLLCIPAGYGVKQLYEAYLQRTLKLSMTSLFITVITLVVVMLPVEKTNFAQSYNSLAVYMKNQEKYILAEQYYRKAVELQPAYPSPYYNLALLYQKLGNHKDADELMREYDRLKNIHL